MNGRNKISDEELRDAAIEVMKYELAIFDSYADFSDHTFHGEFRLKMAALLHDVKRGAVKAAEYSMGVTFYLKRCIAAMLLVFTLACITMPETVLAAYHKIIEVVETVFEDYTEYRYRVNDDGAIEETFRPLKLGYLPEGMVEVSGRETKDSLMILYMSEEKYFRVYQRLLRDSDVAQYLINTESMQIKKVFKSEEEIQFVISDREVQFVWLHKNYYIVGKSNYSEGEIKKIIQSIEV